MGGDPPTHISIEKLKGKTVQSKSNSENFEVKETAVNNQPISVSEDWNHEYESSLSDWDDLTTTPAVVESRAVVNKPKLAPPKTKNNTPRGPTGKHNKIGYYFNGYKSPTGGRRRNRRKPNVKISRGAHECRCKSLHKCEPFSMFQVVRMNSALIHLWHNYYV